MEILLLHALSIFVVWGSAWVTVQFAKTAKSCTFPDGQIEPKPLQIESFILDPNIIAVRLPEKDIFSYSDNVNSYSLWVGLFKKKIDGPRKMKWNDYTAVAHKKNPPLVMSSDVPLLALPMYSTLADSYIWRATFLVCGCRNVFCFLSFFKRPEVTAVDWASINK